MKAARWQFRSRSTLSPGAQHRASAVWIPMVDPPVKNWHPEKPNRSAHSCCAVSKGSPAVYRFPVVGISVTSMGARGASSGRGKNRPLWPGIWNRAGSPAA